LDLIKPSDPIVTLSELASVVRHLRDAGAASINAMMNLAIFRLAVCCGLNATELADLRFRDILVDGAEPYVRAGAGQKERRISLLYDAETLEDLAHWEEQRRLDGAGADDWFLCARAKGSFGRKLSRFKIGRRFKTACGCLNRPVTINCGHRTFIRILLAAGVQPRELAAAAGIEIATVHAYRSIPLSEVPDEIGNIFRPRAAPHGNSADGDPT
jgi:integrase